MPIAATNDTKRKRVTDQIVESLLESIRSGELPDGAALPTERELCDTFSTSRPTVREALSLLQLRGYLSTGSGKRPRVARPSIANVLASAGDHIGEILGDAESSAHLEQMRQFIEAGAARVAAARANNIQIAKMQSALENNFRAIGTVNFADTDIAFHRSIVAVVENPILLTMHDMFVSKMLSHRPKFEDQVGHDELVYEDHRSIYEAVLNRNIVAAAGMVDEHLERSYRNRLATPKSLKSPKLPATTHQN